VGFRDGVAGGLVFCDCPGGTVVSGSCSARFSVALVSTKGRTLAFGARTSSPKKSPPRGMSRPPAWVAPSGSPATPDFRKPLGPRWLSAQTTGAAPRWIGERRLDGKDRELASFSFCLCGFVCRSWTGGLRWPFGLPTTRVLGRDGAHLIHVMNDHRRSYDVTGVSPASGHLRRGRPNRRLFVRSSPARRQRMQAITSRARRRERRHEARRLGATPPPISSHELAGGCCSGGWRE